MTTYDKIFEAADKLDFQGKAVTLASVREVLGGGSYSTITPALKEWKVRKGAQLQLPVVPEELNRRLMALSTELWNQACQIVEKRFVGERMELEEQIKQLESNLNDAASAADSAEAAKELAEKKVTELQESIEPLRAKLNEQMQRATEAVIRHQESEHRIKDLLSMIDMLAKQNDERNAKNNKLASALTDNVEAMFPLETKIRKRNQM
ncbi:DNA-binding protein [Pelobacter propionicus]|uniref:KfrA N-terminal DNA-binding domain-containing protein n=1 Tax=Pelobacter propionicus (strain DSM 2379 / NBRC 103807 / OttBd1) TaxID=338966 RepID=A1AQ82_PELPD|nr:DNA-binding protein [Pelobacter propionicus]ABK99502.1 conserved hypothetical protein [Pelobacter propionicus DSM 2379]